MKTLVLALYLWTQITFLALNAKADSVKPDALQSITNASLATNDLFLIFDTSAAITKKMQVAQMDLHYTKTFATNACSSGQYARQISSGGLLSCSAVSVGQVSGALASADFTDAAVTSKLLTGYSSGAGTVTGADTILQAINKLNGNAGLALQSAGFIEEWTGGIETVADKTYPPIIPRSRVARKVVSFWAKCASGSVTVALKIDGTNITTCNAVSISTGTETVCDTGSTSTLAANSRLNHVTTSNSTCLDFEIDIKTARQ